MGSKKSAAAGRRSSMKPAKRRGSVERRVGKTLAKLERALAEPRTTWMIIGGFAVIAHGVRRTTEDIDLVVRGEEADARRLVATFEPYGIRPRVADAETFARASLVLLLLDTETGIPLDLSFGWSAFEQDALTRRKKEAFGSVRLPVASVEDLVVYKALAGRPKDLDDIETLLLTHPKVNVARMRRWIRALAKSVDAPEMAERLDELLAKVKRLRS
jgi:predicted nucleotidyltransferase